MDALDLILLEAWNRVSKRVREQRVLALKRSQRRFKGILTRPMRPWCLVIRGSDTRINVDSAHVDPRSAIEAREPHALTLTGSLIRDLTKPISIAWPGVTYEDAARICGREYKTMRTWVRQGMFRIDHYREFGFPEGSRRSGRIKDQIAGGKPNRLPPRAPKIAKESDDDQDVAGEASRLWARRFIGGGRPYVWTESPIDPNNCTGRAPHPVWGTLWQWLWQSLPEEYELVVMREPLWCTCRHERVFRGWEFVCPGRMVNGVHRECGRRCRYLYLPRTVWTLAQAMGDGKGIGFDMPPPEESGLVGQWFPGLSDPIQSAPPGQRSFACNKCWRVRGACMARSDGWNEFVSQISGGLLYGRDVPRPADICPKMRKKRPYKSSKPHPLKRESVPNVERIAAAS